MSPKKAFPWKGHLGPKKGRPHIVRKRKKPEELVLPPDEPGLSAKGAWIRPDGADGAFELQSPSYNMSEGDDHLL